MYSSQNASDTLSSPEVSLQLPSAGSLIRQPFQTESKATLHQLLRAFTSHPLRCALRDRFRESEFRESVLCWLGVEWN